MALAKRGTVPIDSIQETFFVRQKLDDDHVLHLAAVYEAGGKLPPISVVRATNELIDGRHRLAALKLCNKKAVDVEWSDETDKGKNIVAALEANIGGALPPTTSDIVYSIEQMVEAGLTYSTIIKYFQKYWPVSVIRRYFNDAQSGLSRQRLIKAKLEVVNGKTVEEAAIIHKVKLDALKQAIAGSKKIKKSDVAQYKKQLTVIFRSRGGSMGQLMRKVASRYEDGELSWKAVNIIIEHCEHLVKQAATSVRDMRRRMEAKSGEVVPK